MVSAFGKITELIGKCIAFVHDVAPHYVRWRAISANQILFSRNLFLLYVQQLYAQVSNVFVGADFRLVKRCGSKRSSDF